MNCTPDYLVTDEKGLCQTAFDRGSLVKLSDLVHSLTPPATPDNKAPPEWEEDEPESLCCLREAAHTTIAVLPLADNDIRRDVTDGQRLLPPLASALTTDIPACDTPRVNASGPSHEVSLLHIHHLSIRA